jgi:hypothetical protein
MKELLQQILGVLLEILSQQKLQLIPIDNFIRPDNWIDQRTAMHMTMRSERQLFRYVKNGNLITKKIGNSNVYLESSILNIVNKTE